MNKVFKIFLVILAVMMVIPLLLVVNDRLDDSLKPDNKVPGGTSTNEAYVLPVSTVSFVGTPKAIPEMQQSLSFTSGGVTMNGITLNNGIVSFYNNDGSYNSVVNGVVNDTYSVITIDTPQKVSYEFYKWFTENTEAFVPFKVSGLWRFNDVVELDNEFGYAEVATFTCNGDVYNSFVSYGAMDGIAFSSGYDNDIEDWIDFIEVYDANSRTWSDEKYRIIDFGATPQIVSEEFYTWFTANATSICEISGIYHFNEEVDITGVGDFKFEASPILENVNFTVTLDGTNYPITSVSMEGTSLYFENEDLNMLELGYPYADSWQHEDLRTIDFGTSVQYVSKVFYDWLAENAVKSEYIIAGTYNFNSTISRNLSVSADITFAYNGNTYNDFSLSDGVIYFGDDKVYDSEASGWVNVNMITISSNQLVNKEFYDWFVANTTAVIPAGNYEITPAA